MTHLSLSSLGERALIRRIQARLAASLTPRWVHVGPGDDAAVLAPERGALDVLTTDAVVEGIHFDRAFVPMDAVGHRALAVNLSDLAAMGAQPRAALLSLVMPGSLELDGVDQLLDGLLKVAAEHRVSLVGGNVARSSGPLVVDVTALGSVRPRRVLTRSGARPGDDIYVTGELGAAATGLTMLRERPERPPEGDTCVARYLRPIPRVRAGVLLGRNRAASSCMDLSDGLADAVHQVSEASGVGMVIEELALPIAAGVREWHGARGGDAVLTALSGGDDYELLFTVRPTQRGRLRDVRTRVGNLPITRIGVVTRDRGVVLTGPDGPRALPRGYEHF